MDKKIFILLAFVIVLLAGVVFFKFWKVEKPEVTIKDGLVVLSPQENEEVTSPLKIRGYVNGGGWAAFEGQAGWVELKAEQGGVAQVLGTALLTATGEWMTQIVNFETTLSFNPKLAIGDLTLQFHNENPSGSPENERSLVLPIKVSGQETMMVNVYFSKNDSGTDCGVVYPFQRVISKTQAVAAAALTELFKGPTDIETAQGFFTSITPGVKINSLVIEGETAKVDFSEELGFNAGGSCKIVAIRSQIDQTLKQFPTVKYVFISINGESELILQP